MMGWLSMVELGLGQALVGGIEHRLQAVVQPKRMLAGPAVPSPRTVPEPVAQAGAALRAAAVDPEK